MQPALNKHACTCPPCRFESESTATEVWAQVLGALGIAMGGEVPLAHARDVHRVVGEQVRAVYVPRPSVPMPAHRSVSTCGMCLRGEARLVPASARAMAVCAWEGARRAFH